MASFFIKFSEMKVGVRVKIYNKKYFIQGLLSGLVGVVALISLAVIPSEDLTVLKIVRSVVLAGVLLLISVYELRCGCSSRFDTEKKKSTNK